MATEKEKRSAKQQAIELDPPVELVFRGPFTDVVTSSLKLTNPTRNTILYKVKTTAPKQYCVRPNSGILNAGEEASVSVMLQPIDLSLPDSERSKHKFMVQTMFAPPDFLPDQIDTVWKTAAKDVLMDSKLKCVFDVTPVSESPAHHVPDNDAAAAEKAALVESYANNTSLPLTTMPENPKDSEPQPAASQPSQVLAGATPAKAALVKQADSDKDRAQLESSLRLLQEKLDKLTRENDQLKGEASRLRQRVPAGQSTAKPTAVPTVYRQQPSSSPLSIIAILLILVALVLGYLVGRLL